MSDIFPKRKQYFQVVSSKKSTVLDSTVLKTNCLGEQLTISASENCYSDLSENRLLPYKATLDFDLGTHTSLSYRDACKASCETTKYEYFGVQLTQPKDGLECWCGHTQPLK